MLMATIQTHDPPGQRAGDRQGWPVTRVPARGRHRRDCGDPEPRYLRRYNACAPGLCPDRPPSDRPGGWNESGLPDPGSWPRGTPVDNSGWRQTSVHHCTNASCADCGSARPNPNPTPRPAETRACESPHRHNNRSATDRQHSLQLSQKRPVCGLSLLANVCTSSYTVAERPFTAPRPQQIMAFGASRSDQSTNNTAGARPNEWPTQALIVLDPLSMKVPIR